MSHGNSNGFNVPGYLVLSATLGCLVLGVAFFGAPTHLVRQHAANLTHGQNAASVVHGSASAYEMQASASAIAPSASQTDHSTDNKWLQYAQPTVAPINAPVSNSTPVHVVSVNPVKLAPRVVPLKVNRNALMVEATLSNPTNGRQVNGTFIIDTGATYTSISKDLAVQLGLDLDGRDNVHITTANGRINVPKVSIGQIQVNGVKAHDVQATVIEVRPDSSFNGLLGLSFIRQFKMTIDPEANQLVFESP